MSTARTCPMCLATVNEADCITDEHNVCPLRDPCAVEPRGRAWPPRGDDGDSDSEAARAQGPVAPAVA